MADRRYHVDIDPSNGNTSHSLILSLVGGNKTVLDIGCAEGDLARALVQAGCTVTGVERDPAAAERARPDLAHLVIGDLSSLDLVEALGSEQFDVIIYGDVLEHLADPLATLRQAKTLLRPNGFAVLSVPNVAHADVRFSLLLGRFPYRPTGLLDDTHLRFFTRTSLMDLLRDAGLAPMDVRRTTAEPFQTELGVAPTDIDAGTVRAVLADPDATTYQFVLTAAPDNAVGRWRELGRQAAAMAAEAATARADADHWRTQAQELTAEADRLRDRLAHAEQVDVARDADRSRLHAEVQHSLALVQAMRGSTSWRLTAPVRILGPLRTAVQGPPQTRLSVRSRAGVKAALQKVRREGLKGLRERAEDARRADLAYAEWVERYDTLAAADERAIREHMTGWRATPMISVIMPVYDSNPATLTEAINSVQDQIYPNWELCLADDASPSADVRRQLAELANGSEKIRIAYRTENGGIARATNSALSLASGEFVAFMDHDDVLPRHALYLVAEELQRHPDAALLYTDEDKLDSRGLRYGPTFKPDLNLDLLLAQNYVNHLTVVRTSLMRQLGGLRTDLDGAQDHDLVLRAVAASRAEHIRHIPHIGYHWRAFSGSGTFSAQRLSEATRNSRSAVRQHIAATTDLVVEVEVAPRNSHWNRVRWPLPTPAPAVTVVIPTRDRVGLLRQTVHGLLEGTDYEPLDILIVDNDSTDPETIDYLAAIASDPRVGVMPVPGPFNYSRINNTAVASTATPYVCLLNNDVVVRHNGWLREMMSHAVRPDVGVVGAKLLYADGRIQHGGVILGIGGVAGHSHKHRPADELGYGGRLILTQDLSAVTGACLLTSRQLWAELGGLNEVDLGVALNDVDFCLRARAAGKRVIWTPYAELDHLESASRGLEDTEEKRQRFAAERSYMTRQWGSVLASDPAYNLNLTDSAEDFSLAYPPRGKRPWR